MPGIEDTDVIDLVAQDADGVYLVVMVETRPWGSDPDQPMQLREKINSAAGYVLNGQLVEQFPDAAGQPTRIQLDCVEPPTPEIAQLTEWAAAQLAPMGVDFRVNVRA